MEVINEAERERMDVAKSQATYARRRSSLFRKANEISVFCNVDIALVAFSPAGRVSKFCNKERMEELIERYINVVPAKRYPHIGSLQWKLHRIRQLDHIRGDERKLSHIETQIKNLELQIKKSTLELGILQTQIKEYEPVENGEKASLAEILRCEKNLKQTLQVITARKVKLSTESNPSSSLGQAGLRAQEKAPLAYESYPFFGQRRLHQQKRPAQAEAAAPLTFNYGGNQVQKRVRNNQASSSTDQFPSQYDPRTWPYFYRFPNPSGASSSYAFNPRPASFPAINYHPAGYPCITPQTEIPPAYPAPIQYRPCYWDPAAASSAPNWHLGAYGNPSMHRPIIGNPAVPFVPCQQMGTWGAKNLYRQMMPAIVDQQLGGWLRSSSAQQMMRQDQIRPTMPYQQPGAFGGSFLEDQPLMVDGGAPYGQFNQPAGVNPTAGIRLAKDPTPISDAHQENPIPISYQNYNIPITQNDAPQQPTSQFPDFANLSFSPANNTTQNMDVTPNLDSEMVSSFFANDIGSITDFTTADGGNINNGGNGGSNNGGNIENGIGNYGNNIVGNPDGPTQENPPPASPTDSFFLDCLLDEAAMELNDKPQAAAGNQEDDTMDWDGFVLAENLNLEDLDIIF